MNIPNFTLLKKKSGITENYSKEKLKKSILRIGLEEKDSEDLAKEIEDSLTPDNLDTTKIYDKTHEMLYKRSHIACFKYSLRTAILALGPSGFIFEKYIAKALEEEGYQSETNLYYEGCCVRHEVDLKASKDNYTLLAECKFHNNQDTKNDLKTVLYVKARMDDLKSNPNNQFTDFFLISNTSFSSDAIKYSKCAGLKLLGFNYPEDETLYKLLEKNKHYPITSIPWLKKSDINFLFDNHIILIHDLYKNLNLLEKRNYSKEEIENFKINYEKYFSKA
jgi:hypothetical protein